MKLVQAIIGKPLMINLTDPRLIYVKGVLFLFAGLMAAGLLLFVAPSLIVGVLLTICVWSFCRCYYFAFYVIEHYVDGDFRYAGLLDFFAYAVKQRLGWRRNDDNDTQTP